MGGEKRRRKSLRIGVHHANAVVWGPVYRTRTRSIDRSERASDDDDDDDGARTAPI